VKNLFSSPGIGFILVLLLAGCALEEPDDHAFWIENGQLMRGDKTWNLRAVESPEIGKPGTPYEAIASALHRAAEVGASNIGFELGGLSADGGTLTPEGLAAFRSVIHEATERHMGAVCRVFPATASASFKYAAVTAVATSLANSPEAVYLIDGPGAKDLAEELKNRAPKLLAASQEGGQVKLVDASQKPAAGKEPVLVVGGIPADLNAFPHFLVSAKPEIYPQLDAALADPIESKPWTPDNSVLSPEERGEGWIALFDGKSLSGWTITGWNPKGWRVHDGMLEWAEDGGGVVRSRDRYENFILRLDWKIEEGGNSGVFLRAPRTARASRIGLETQIQGDHGQPISNSSTGSIYVQVQPLLDATKPDGEWNSYEITLNGPLLKVMLNGQLVQNLNLDENPELKIRIKRGFIGLQDHHRFVAFRNIRIKVL
jgi:hypothetical protein